MSVTKSDLMSAIKKRTEKLGKTQQHQASKTLVDTAVTGFFSTGSYRLDYLIRRPGIPHGRISELSGWRSSGKSTIAAKCIASCQSQGGVAFLFDTEDAYTSEWLSRMGCNPEEVITFPNISTTEHIFDVIDSVIIESIPEGNTTPILIVVDSYSGIESEQEHEKVDTKGFGAKGMALGSHARIASAALRRIPRKAAKRNIAILFCSQLKEAPSEFGVSTKKIGGHAIEYHASLLIELGHVTAVVEEKPFGLDGVRKESVGFVTRAIIKKSKLGGPAHIKDEITIFYDDGPDRQLELLELAVEGGMISEASGWYRLKDSNIPVSEETYFSKGFRKSFWKEFLTKEPKVEQYIKSIFFPNDCTLDSEIEDLNV